MIKVAIFDIDGTLIDSVDAHARAWAETLEHFGVAADLADLRLEIGKGGDQLLPGFVSPSLMEARGDEMEAFRANLFKQRYLPDLKAIPGARALFQRLQRDGITTVVASSAKADEVDRYLGIAGVGDLVQGVVSSDDAERSKPFPDIFEAALKPLQPITPEQAVVIGDAPYDAEAARAAGCPCVGVLTGGFSRDALRDAGCIAVFDSVGDLLEQIDRSPFGRIGG